MVQQQYNLKLSWKTQLLSGILYAVLIIAILLIPWPEQDWPIWLILVLLIAVECVLTQRRINKTKGVFTLLNASSVQWADEKWQIIRSPYILSFGIFFSLKAESSGKITRLWIAADSMSHKEWRSLCYEIAHNK